MKWRNRDNWRRLVAGMAIATVAALALGAIGLSEVSWAPFFAVAAGSGRRSGGFHLARRGARS